MDDDADAGGESDRGHRARRVTEHRLHVLGSRQLQRVVQASSERVEIQRIDTGSQHDDSDVGPNRARHDGLQHVAGPDSQGISDVGDGHSTVRQRADLNPQAAAHERELDACGYPCLGARSIELR
jgi:hypothetical protein